MSLNTVFKPTRSQGGALLFVLLILIIYPAMLVGIAWVITLAITSIVANGIAFWPILGLVFALWVIASWFSPKK